MAETIPTDETGLPESDYLLDATLEAHQSDNSKFAAFRAWIERLAADPESLRSNPHAIVVVSRILAEKAEMRTFPDDFPSALKAEAERLGGTDEEAREVVLRWQGHLMDESARRFSGEQAI